MKNIKRCVVLLILILFVCTLSVVIAFASDSSALADNLNHCYHSFAFEFNDQTMTIDGAYKTNTIEWLMDDVDFYGDKAIVYENGTMLTEGYLQEGMIVAIFHGDQLYDKYTIENLREPHSENPPKQNNPYMDNPDTAPQTGRPINHLLLIMMSTTICMFLLAHSKKYI